jgi:hypothetical protein
MQTKNREITVSRSNDEWTDILQGINLLYKYSLYEMLSTSISKEDADRITIAFEFRNDLERKLHRHEVEKYKNFY